MGRECDSAAIMEVANPEPVKVKFFAIRTGYGADGYWHINGKQFLELHIVDVKSP